MTARGSDGVFMVVCFLVASGCGCGVFVPTHAEVLSSAADCHTLCFLVESSGKRLVGMQKAPQGTTVLAEPDIWCGRGRDASSFVLSSFSFSVSVSVLVRAATVFAVACLVREAVQAEIHASERAWTASIAVARLTPGDAVLRVGQQEHVGLAATAQRGHPRPHLSVYVRVRPPGACHTVVYRAFGVERVLQVASELSGVLRATEATIIDLGTVQRDGLG